MSLGIGIGIAVCFGDAPRAAGGAPALPANTTAPTMSGIPREGESASIGAGDWTLSPNKYRYTVSRNGTPLTPVVQTVEEYHFDFTSADVGTLVTATVEASNDNGTTWSAPADAYLAFYPDTNLIEPNNIAQDSTVTRTSSANALPLTFDVTATVYPSYMWQIRIYDQDFVTLKYEGIKAVSEAELTSPFTPDFSGANGPSPDPAMPTLLNTDVVVMRFITQDWLENTYEGTSVNNAGRAGPWMGVSSKDFGGNRFWKLAIASTAGGGVSSGCVMTEVELAETVGGTDLAQGKNYAYSPGHYGADTPGGSTFATYHIFDGHTYDFGALSNAVNLPGYIIIDMLIPRPIAELRITHYYGNYLSAPSNFTFGPCLSDGTAIGSPPVSASSVSWSNSVNETKSYDFGATGNFILLSDGVSKILLSDNTSHLLRAA